MKKTIPCAITVNTDGRFGLSCVLLAIALGAASCVNSPPPAPPLTPASFVIRSAGSCRYEFFLDGQFVGSGQVAPDSPQTNRLALAAGTHLLSVRVDGRETWRKEVTVLADMPAGQQFLIAPVSEKPLPATRQRLETPEDVPPPAPRALSGNGSGTDADPYRVVSAEQLQEVENALDAHYVLAASIDATDSDAAFRPIGDRGHPFTGTITSSFEGATEQYHRGAGGLVALNQGGDTGGSFVRHCFAAVTMVKGPASLPKGLLLGVCDSGASASDSFFLAKEGSGLEGIGRIWPESGPATCEPVAAIDVALFQRMNAAGADWDFERVWKMDSQSGLPVLRTNP